MKIDSNCYEMVIQQFFKMVRAEEVTPELAGKTIATFLYSESLENAVETLVHALTAVLRQNQSKRSWDEREQRKYLEDLAYAKRTMKSINL